MNTFIAIGILVVLGAVCVLVALLITVGATTETTEGFN